MASTLRSHRYGKQRVRLTHLDRTVEPHRLTIAAVGIELEGDFVASYTDGDNRKVVATDSMKNTVYVLARERGVGSVEELAIALARHFVSTYEAVGGARIEIEEELWTPIRAAGGEAPDAFERTASELGTASVALAGDELDVVSGFDGLKVLKSARSAFADFHRDRFATLPDTDDRLFATAVRASWRLAPETVEHADWRALRAAVRSILIETFAGHDSLAVQQTLHAMGEAALAALPELSEITLVLPNQHHLKVDLAPFGLDNPNVVFAGTSEPFGQIEATLSR
jgi:urate oxidase